MRILLDNCVPQSLRRAFVGHEAETTAYHGWQELTNGKLLDAAESARFEVFVTVDANLPHQQNVAARRLRVVVLVARDNRAATLLPLVPDILAAMTDMAVGELRQISLAETNTDGDRS